MFCEYGWWSLVGNKTPKKHPSYVTFKYLRENNAGGGLLIAVHKTLKPVSVSNDTEEEVLVVAATIVSKKVRLINAYGPQEDEKEDIRESFNPKWGNAFE